MNNDPLVLPDASLLLGPNVNIGAELVVAGDCGKAVELFAGDDGWLVPNWKGFKDGAVVPNENVGLVWKGLLGAEPDCEDVGANGLGIVP